MSVEACESASHRPRATWLGEHDLDLAAELDSAMRRGRQKPRTGGGARWQDSGRTAHEGGDEEDP